MRNPLTKISNNFQLAAPNVKRRLTSSMDAVYPSSGNVLVCALKIEHYVISFTGIQVQIFRAEVAP
jgi:hypothetical protein